MNRVRAALVLCSLLMAVGCSFGGEGTVRVPPGFREYRTGDYGFAYPATWRRVDGKDDYGRPVLMFQGPALASGVTEGVIHVNKVDDFHGDFDAQLSQFRGLVLLNRYRPTPGQPMKIDGAIRAHRFETTYELENESSGGRVPFKLLGMYVLTERHVLVEFMLRSPMQGNAAAKLPEIFRSFRLFE